jgi:hypothetical protein
MKNRHYTSNPKSQALAWLIGGSTVTLADCSMVRRVDCLAWLLALCGVAFL